MKTLENPPKNPTAEFLDDYAMERIEFRARQLAQQYKGRGDWEDLRQDMVVELLEAAERFDPAKASRETFIARVLDRFEIDLYRENARNQEVQCVSLDDPSVERDFLEDCSSVVEPSGQEQTDLSSDVESLIAGLPPELAEVCCLLKHYSFSETARRLDIGRGTLYRRVEAIRKHFARAGYDDFSIAQGDLQ